MGEREQGTKVKKGGNRDKEKEEERKGLGKGERKQRERKKRKNPSNILHQMTFKSHFTQSLDNLKGFPGVSERLN